MSSTVLITGGSGPIGQEIMKTCRLKGIKTLRICSENDNEVEKVSNKSLKCDLSNSAEIVNLIEKLKTIEGTFFFMHCARKELIIDKRKNRFEVLRALHFNEVLFSTIVPEFIGTELYKANKLSGMLIASSVFGSRVRPQAFFKKMVDKRKSQAPSYYGTAKASGDFMIKQLASSFSEKGVPVNSLVIGGVKSKRTCKEVEEAYSDCLPAKRMVELKEVAEAFIMLYEQRTNSAITGNNIKVDLGYTI